MLRKTVALLLMTITMVGSISIPAQAAQPISREKPGVIIAEPMWVNTNFAHASLYANGTTLNASVSAQASNLNTYCSGTLYLDKLQNGRWTCVASWGVSGRGYLNVSKSYYGSSGQTYRCRASLQVGSDQITSYSGMMTVR